MDLLLFYENKETDISIKLFLDKYIGPSYKKNDQHCLFLNEDLNISKALDEMQLYKKHMVIVTRNDENNIDNKNRICIGIITLEDIIEYILKEDIFDEDEKKIYIKNIGNNKEFKDKVDKFLNNNEINAIAS